MLQLEPGMMIWTWVTFFVLFLILARLAWKPLLSAVENREKTISDSLKRAEDAKLQAQKLMEEQHKILAGAQEDIQKMIKENKEIAENIKNEIIEKARSEAQKLHERARADLERETEAAALQLKKQVVDLVIQAASGLIRENLDSKKNRALIDQYIKELNQVKKN
jgi:F-type H+-transporting ATPase subunit b